MRTRPARRTKPYNITLYAHEAELLRRNGGGNLSAGIRIAYLSRSHRHYEALTGAVRALLDARDAGEDISPHARELRRLLHVTRRPGYLRP